MKTNILVAIVALGVCTLVLNAQESVITVQTIQIERNAQPGDYITLQPPNAAITPYTMIWPATPPATDGLALTATGTSSPYQLAWGVAAGLTIELFDGSNGSLRRIAALNEGGIAGQPGNYANDFQGSRDNSSQTASGDYSLIAGGEDNTASGNYSLVLGGQDNTASGNYGVVAGGHDNVASGIGGAVLSGINNTAAGDYSSIGSGDNNAVTSTGTYGVIGGGEDNTVSGLGGFVGSGNHNTASGIYTVVGGGDHNQATDTAAVVAGGSNNTASGKRSVVGGGDGNTASGELSFVGAGTNNTASGLASAVGAGSGNTASGAYSLIGGGVSNSNGQDYGVIGGGQSNSMSTGTHSAIIGGASNSITGSYSFIGGGQSNSIASDYSAIPGGRGMTLASGSDGSFGWNATGNSMSVSSSGVFVVANAEFWLANNNSTPSKLKFYESYGSSGSFPSTANFVSFQAPASTNANQNNTYTLPDRIGSAGQVLTLATGATSTTATLQWSTLVNQVVTTVNVTADDQAITAAQMDGVTFLRLSSNGTAGNRTVTLANGATDGLRLVIRCVAGAGDGIELADGGNLALNAGATLNNQDTITLMWDATNTTWIELFRSDN
ncbi:MAG: hypothetical protein J5I53_04320 [Bradyrhizobiaceae bacterium]|nr:hypothetical protein [Bradyrhizobiaceae bacterium]